MNESSALITAVLCALVGIVPATAEEQPATALVQQSIAWHDPDGEWSKFRRTLELREARPDGSERRSSILLDSDGDPFVLESIVDDVAIRRALIDGECSAALNGRTDLTPGERKTHRLECQNIKRYRDYYLFLWGLPMKLRDPGARIDPDVKPTTFEGSAVLSVRVTYDPDIGGDTWYFYFHPETARLIGCRFFHDEAKNDGEYIVFDEIYTINSMRLPNVRRWYVNKDGRHLGTDTILAHR